MKTLCRICRFLFSLTFILSGIFKLIDPVGTGLIVDEYLKFMHLTAFSDACVWIGILLAVAEFTIGICVLVGLKMRLVSTVALCLVSFFTLLTLYLAIFNPITDCGCFGEAFHLTNWQTFAKNAVLLAFALIIYFERNNMRKLAPDWLQWTIIGISILFALALAIYEKETIPHIDYTAYTSGTDLNDIYSEGQAQFNTVFIYQKDGRQEEFTLNNLPDSSWRYVDTRTEITDGSVRMSQIDFEPHTLEGRFFAVSVYDTELLEDERFLGRLEAFRARVPEEEAEVALYTPEGGNGAYSSDRKSLMTLNRSNGGVTYFSDGVIVKKWPACDIDRIDAGAVLDEDPDVVILQQRISEQIFVSVLVSGVLVILLLIRFFCGFFMKKK